MAESVASALLSVIFEKLTDEALKKYGRSQNIHNELNELKTTLSRIQDLLNDASHKEVTDKSVKNWLIGLQHLAYDIDDVLDDLATEALHRELTDEPEPTTSMVRKLLPICCTNFSLSHRLSPKLDRINTQLQQLEKRKSDLGLIVKDEKPKNTNRRNETCLLESDVVGREDEREKLINMLLQDEPSKENFVIVPIVGLGGVGKTTLARMLFNDTQVKGHFELMAWVCVSDEFDVFKISETIFQSVAAENKQFKDVNQIHIALREQLKDKRFLIVLDDVWNENYDDWENLVRPFHFGARGSRVIMTTRKEQLLKKLGFNQIEHLESLSHEDAVSLFALHALGVDNFDSHATLKPQGEGIVKKCGRLPLALKAIGRLLRTKIDEEDWDNVLNSEIWELEHAGQIVPALRLSYHDLSVDLKRLFAYCSLFPKDFLFDKEELVLLWMAEGYMNESPANKSPECLGNEYFDKLLSRSFFQPAPNGESFFVMHDLMNDLATFVAGEFFLRFDNQMEMADEALAKYRHMSFIREEYVTFQRFEAFQRARNLRTLLAVYAGVEQSWWAFYISSKILVDLLPRLPLLRVLSLRRFNISEVPDFICSLNHLRYLNLSQTKILELPENVGNLYNLQTLIVFGCKSLSTLPKSFSKLKKLRHFDIGNTPLLKKLPLGIGELRNLQILTKIIIGGDGDFAITELKGLKNLHGKLSIEGLHEVQSPMHAREANLSMRRLTKLELKWGDGSQREKVDMEILNELKPHNDTLNFFSVECYGGIEFPGWVGDPSFRDLLHVSIRGCRKCTTLPPFGQLPSLKELFIQGLDEVKVIGPELVGNVGVVFRSLEVLRFEDMLGWEVWLTNSEVLDAVFPCLREFHIKNCPKLRKVSLKALPLLRVLSISRCHDGVLRSLVQVASSITKLEINSISGLTYEVWRGVLEHIRAIEEIRISECNEIRYLWESEEEAGKVLMNIRNLEVSYCSNLLSLGEKEEGNNFGSSLLSSLRVLYVKSCVSMERCCFPISMETLHIYYCDSLTYVSFSTAAIGGSQNLKSLSIYGCNKLMEKINTSMPMLEVVFIGDWTNLKSIIQFSNLVHLTALSILDCPGIESFPNLQLPNLTRLIISRCQNLKSFPDLKLMNLTSLDITSCPSIDDSFPRGVWPPKLCSLEIGGLRKPISEWGDQNFPTSLVDLRLYHESHVSNFSQLSHLLPSSLKELTIGGFDNLESLSMGLQHLTSLQHLEIYKCPKLTHLPEFEMLLSSLSRLSIVCCPKLKERCNGRGSHYWSLISHIPCIRILE